MKAYIPNPGFYESIFSHVLDYAVECEQEYFEECEGRQPEEAYKEASRLYSNANQDNIARVYVSLFQEWLEEYKGLDINLTFFRVISPAFYNFESDKIEVEMTDNDAYKLYNTLIVLPDVQESIKCAGTPSSGYVPFVSPDWQHDDWKLENLRAASWEVMLTPFYNFCIEDERRFYAIEEAARNAIY